MDMISNTILIITLIIASIQDFVKKSVSDIIHYLLLIFAFSFSIYHIFKGFIFESYLFSYFILLFFLVTYLLRFLAIGDLYILFSLFFFLATFNLQKIFKFLVMLSVGGVIVHNIEAIKIFLKNKEKKEFIITTFSLILDILAGFFYSIALSNIYYEIYLFMLSSIFLLISIIILKFFESRLKKELTFERTVDELVEGDWIENDIKIKEIPEFLLDDINKNFILEKENEYYIIKIKGNNNKILKFIIFVLFLIPLFFYKNINLFIISVILLILFVTIFHDTLFKNDLGLSKKQIELLKKIIDKQYKFTIIEGAPFVPAMTFAYILSII